MTDDRSAHLDERFDAQPSSPLACVSCLPYRVHEGLLQVGLIKRDDLEGGIRYGLVGGQIRYEETTADALTRLIATTLGEDARCRRLELEQTPDTVSEYFPRERIGYPFHPRQHSINLTWLVALDGTVHPCGDAVAFSWFAISDIPARPYFCFRQWLVIDELLTMLDPVTLVRASSAVTSGIAACARARLAAGEDPQTYVAVLVGHGHHRRRVLASPEFEKLALADLQ